MNLRRGLQWIVLSLVLAGLLQSPVTSLAANPGPQPASLAGADLLRGALQRAQAAGSYRIAVDVHQTVTLPDALSDPSSNMRIEGEIAGPQQARLLLTEGEVRAPLLQSPLLTASGEQEILLAGGALYQREGDRWVKQPQALSAPGLTGDALLLLEVARDLVRLDPITTLGGTFERVAFTLNSRDVLRFMLQQSGPVDAQTELRLALSGLSYGGSGELWIDAEGYPARLALNLALSRGGSDPYEARATSTTLYSSFGETFSAVRFDPTLGPLSLSNTAPIPGVRLSPEQLSSLGLLVGMLAAVGAAALTLARRGRLSRPAHAALSLVLVAALLAPVVVQAAAPNSGSLATDAAGRSTELASLLETARAAGERQRAEIALQAGELDDQADEDGDGLPNGYELKLGTNPFAPDTDLDGLTDDDEVLGIACLIPTGSVKVETDPLNPDSNSDGIRDGDEFDHGVCRYTGAGNRPYPWDDDNDSDGVPDDLDLSPFTVSQPFATDGANLTFETMDSIPGVSSRELYYFELQVVPTERRLLQYAYKSALEWPIDDKGLIQHDPDLGSSGMLEIAPFLEVTLDDDDLPSVKAMSDYGVGSAPVPTPQNTPSGQSTLVIPLAPIERGGVVVALQAKVFQDRPSDDGIIRWRDARLKWAVQGDVLRPDDAGNMVPSPTGKYGLVVYEEPYRLTGVQSSRQAGASAIVAGAVRTAAGIPDAGPVALLRGALEAQYLGGRLTLGDIYTRFNAGSTATITERWGITQTFAVSGPAYYGHMDQMLLTTNITTTRNLLNASYPAGETKPTLLIATEQHTASLNVDDLENPDFSNLVLNLCLTQLVTSRTLKLASYKWDPTALSASSAQIMASGAASAAGLSALAFSPGDWVTMGLEEVLEEIRDQFDAIYGTLEEYYNEAVGVLQMAMSVWYQGQTVVQSVGDLNLTDVTDALSDPLFYANILSLLDQYGLLDFLPSEFRTVVEFLLGVLQYPGGPVQWLTDQWNTLVTVADEIVGSFKEFAAGAFSPDSLVSFTQTAINVITWLASILDFGFLGEIIKVLYRLLELFKQVQALWNVIQVLAVEGVQVVSEVLNAVTGELGSLAGNLQFVGLIFSVFSTLFSMFLQLASGTLSVLGVIGVILKAVVEIAIAIVLFVVATLFPIGTLVSLAIGVLNLVTGFLKDYFGDVGEVIAAILDPIGALLGALNPDPEAQAAFLGQPRVGQMQLLTFEGEPLGGLIAGDRFGFEITGTVTMSGNNQGLNRSSAYVQLGRYANGETFEICGVEVVQFLYDLGQLDQVPNYADMLTHGTCTTFRLSYERNWSYSRSNDRQRSAIYTVTEIPGFPGVPMPVPTKARDYNATSRLIVNPQIPMLNGVVSLDISIDIRQLWENCGILGLDCDTKVETATSQPSVTYVYFDILPDNLLDLWEWDALTNHDPDGDGLAGNPDQGVLGFDSGLCANPNSHKQISSEPVSDRLTDTFELFSADSSPCQIDTDLDGLGDYEEFILGTQPRSADTDGDGLKDGEEVARWNSGSFYLSAPWRVAMGGAYPGLPDPAAFPNPRVANADRDGLSDRKEKQLASSPNAFDISDIEITVTQELVQGGGTRLRLVGFPWPNDLAPGLSPQLTLTLPIAFSGVTTSARLISSGFPLVPATPGTPLPGMPANTYGWTFPSLTLGRMVQVFLTGLPSTIPADEVFVTLSFSYTEAGVPRQTSDSVPLLLNRGGPLSSVTWPAAGSVASAQSGPIRIQGTADDPEGVGSAQLCITSGAPCTDSQWVDATLGTLYGLGWSYDWTPPVDGAYSVYARAADAYGVSGPASAPVAFYVDSVSPESARFHLDGTAYLSTTLSIGALAAFTVTGEVSDAGGAYISGVGDAGVTAGLTTVDGVELLRAQTTLASPGAPVSPFAATVSLPMMALDGSASPSAQGLYQLSLSAADRAGNTLPNADTLNVIVDDTPPFARLRVPQTVLEPSVVLDGRADEGALSLRRLSHMAYPASQTLADADTRFAFSNPQARAFVVGDLNGDTLDDVVLVEWVADKPLELGIFFARTEGYLPELSLANADVTVYGEVDFGGTPRPPSVAANAPERLDVNGDGIADLLIGDPNVATGAGRAYLLAGRRTWPTSLSLASDATWRLSTSSTVAFGSSVAGAGDLDGDGLGDILVGAVSRSTPLDGFYHEVATLYLGLEKGLPTPTSVIADRNCRTGCLPLTVPNLAGLGDTNGDGLSDWLLAGYTSAWLVPGQPRQAVPSLSLASALALASLQSESAPLTVAPAGDLNGDGLRDMLLGDPQARLSYVFGVFGRRPEQPFPAPLSLPTGADLSFIEQGTGSSVPPIGVSLAPMGDLDRDGKDDFAFGRIGEFGGVAMVFSGRTRWALNLSPDGTAAVIYSSRELPWAGSYLSSGDVDGDAVRDLLVGTLAPDSTSTSGAYLFRAEPLSVVSSGISRVELGVVGPITEPEKPVTATLPTVWLPATLANAGAERSTFSVPISFPADGDYRLYVRATDRASNRLPLEAWYVGTTFVNTRAETLTDLAVSLGTPVLYREGFLRVALAGQADSSAPVQALRVYDGERWLRQPLTTNVPARFAIESNIERTDRRAITFRAVARDAFGNVKHEVITVVTDTLVAAPQLFANLPTVSWSTNITPTLVITWPAVADASGPVLMFASIDRITDTVPTTQVAAGQVSRVLDAPGAWYAHVRVVDAAGNQQVVHDGPYGVNRRRTPSALLPDGWLDFDGGEYTAGMTTSYDPYAALEPALLLATWDADRLYLGFTGADWSAERRLVLYLDTRAGGSTASLGGALPGGEPTHNLTFAADFALVVHGPSAFSLFTSTGGAWSKLASPLSFAVTGDGTEISFSRNEIGAAASTTPVALLGYVATADGVTAVIPPGARSTTEQLLAGPLTFLDAIRWPALSAGYPATPADLPVQRVAPLVQLKPGRLTHLLPGDGAQLVVSITNPDVLSYAAHPLTVTLGSTEQLLAFDSLVGGATCVSCPAGGSEWRVSVNVAASATRLVTFTLTTLPPAAPGIFSVPVSATLAHQGLPTAPQLPATASYTVDNSVAQVGFGAVGSTVFAKPGFFRLPIYADLAGGITSCRQLVSINRGSGWEVLGFLSQASSATADLPSGYSGLWQLRVEAPNGQSSTSSVTVLTDEGMPSVTVTPTPALTEASGYLRGSAEDAVGLLAAVEVSLDGGPFRRALLRRGGLAGIVALTADTVEWSLPVNALGTDGEAVQVVARAVDTAGNVSPLSAPMMVVFDTTGPLITISESLLSGAGHVTDGSGVSSLQVSLDGGLSYQDALRSGDAWSFDYGLWTGGPPVGVLTVRAVDVYGNVSQIVALTEQAPSGYKVFVPLAFR